MIYKSVMVEAKQKTENENVVSMADKPVNKFGVTTDCDEIYISARIQNKPMPLLIDTGVNITIISTSLIDGLELSMRPEMNSVNQRLTVPMRLYIPLTGECAMNIWTGKQSVSHNVVVPDISYDGIMSLEFMKAHSCDISVKNMYFMMKGDFGRPTCNRGAIKENAIVQANTEINRSPV